MKWRLERNGAVLTNLLSSRLCALQTSTYLFALMSDRMLLVQWTADYEAPGPNDLGSSSFDGGSANAGGQKGATNVDRCLSTGAWSMPACLLLAIGRDNRRCLVKVTVWRILPSTRGTESDRRTIFLGLQNRIHHGRQQRDNTADAVCSDGAAYDVLSRLVVA